MAFLYQCGGRLSQFEIGLSSLLGYRTTSLGGKMFATITQQSSTISGKKEELSAWLQKI
jgi:hypothetical protein